MNRQPPVIAISGVTLTGNMGGAAMLHTALAQMRVRLPEASFRLLSIAPDDDRKAVPVAGLEVVPARALALVALYLPLALFAWPFVRLPWVRDALRRIEYFRAIDDADVVVDLCGIAFVDRRGLPLLAYNVACCLPAIVLGRPVAKMSQALGPFETFVNRHVARFVLARCGVVVARGAASFRHLQALGLARARMLPDVTFAMDVTDQDRQAARALLSGIGVRRAPVIVSPSEVVNRLCAREGIDFEGQLAGFLTRLAAAGHQIVLLPHSLARGGSKNNDITLSRRVHERTREVGVLLVEAQGPALLRAIIGEAEIFVGCRFHSVVGAFATGVPALIVGWSHKYAEMAEAFEADRFAMDWRAFSEANAMRGFDELFAQRVEVRQRIAQRLPEVRAGAAANFALAAELAAGNPTPVPR
jgi:polysaccharide pyruvyl transferase WcaK-like protein